MLVLAEEETLEMTPAAAGGVAATLRRRARQLPRRHSLPGHHRRRGVGAAARPARCSGSGSSASTSPRGARRWRACWRCRAPGADAGAGPRAVRRRRARRHAGRELDGAEQLGREACAIYRQFGDTRAWRRRWSRWPWQAQRRGRYAEATALFEETVGAVGAARRRDRRRPGAQQHGDDGQARGRLRQGARAARAGRRRPREARGDVRGVASALNGLGDVAASEGDHDAARRYHQQSLADLSADRRSVGHRRRARGSGARRRRRPATTPRPTSRSREALQAFRELGHQRGVARQLEIAVVVRQLPGARPEAVALASAAAAIRLKIGSPARQGERGAHRADAGARAQSRLSAGSLRRGLARRAAARRSIDLLASGSRREPPESRSGVLLRDRSAGARRRPGWRARPACRACSRIGASSGAR